jgi:multidrug efflux pump subunit AcrA (membrane-fusion protein)
VSTSPDADRRLLRLADGTPARPVSDVSTDNTSHGALASGAQNHDSGRHWRRWWWFAGVFALVSVAAGGWIAGRRIQSPDQAASRAAPPVASWITSPVERRILTQTVISRGDVAAKVSVPVGVPSSIEGAPIVTAIAVANGAEVTEGTKLFEVSGRPIFVLQGDIPVYRSLRPQMTGADVTQLQSALTRLGCDAAADGSVYGAATKECVAELYSGSGYVPVPTSQTEQVDLGAAAQNVADAKASVDVAALAVDKASKGASATEILAADTALAAAQRAYQDAVASKESANTQAVAAVTRAAAALDLVRGTPDATPSEISDAQADLDAARAALDDARRTGAGSVAAANDAVVLAYAARADLNQPPDTSAEQAALDQASQARNQAKAVLESLQASTGPTVAQGEVVFVPTLPARIQQVVTSLGPLTAEGPGAADSGADGAVGNRVGGGQLATLASGELVVETVLRPDDMSLVHLGMSVDLLDEASNVAYRATVTHVSDTQTVGADGQSGFAAIVTPAESLPNLLWATNLRVTITAASTQAVTLVADAGAAPMVVPIKAGLSADGFVSIVPVTDGTLAKGDLVVVGR